MFFSLDPHQAWEALHSLCIKDTCFWNQPNSGLRWSCSVSLRLIEPWTIRWTSSSNTFYSQSFSSLCVRQCIVWFFFSLPLSPKFSENLYFLESFFLAVIFIFSTKPNAFSVQIGAPAITTISAICALCSKAKFVACQNISLGNLAGHVIFSTALKISLFTVHPAKLSKLSASCVLISAYLGHREQGCNHCYAQLIGPLGTKGWEIQDQIDK